MALGFNDQIPMLLNPKMIFFLESACFSVLSTYLAKTILFNSMYFLLIIVVCLYFLKSNLKGLKQVTSKRCNAWDVCEGNITIVSPNACVCLIASRVTHDPWPLKMNKCIFGIKIMPPVVWNL
jgi:hypothetical protein